MISVSTTYNNIISGGGHYEWQIVNGANTYDLTNIMNGTITQTQFEEVSVGNCIAAKLEIDLWNTPSVDTSSAMTVQFRAKNDSSSSAWYTKGVFFIDTIETSPYSEVTHITAFDSMLKTEVVYLKTGTWVETDSYEVLSNIASQIGVSIESATDTLISGSPVTMSAVPNLGENGTTDREMLSYIASMYGGNFIIDSSGNLKLIVLSATPANTANVGDAVVEFDASPAETVQRLRVWITDNEFFAFPELPLQTHIPQNITTHTPENITVMAKEDMASWEALGGYCIDIDLPLYATYELAETLASQFIGKTFIPYDAQNAYVDPKYELGDGITIKDITSVIANQTISIDLLAPSDLVIRGEEILQSYYPYVSPVEREIARVEQRSQASIQITENRIDSVVTEITDNISGTASLLQSEIDSANGAISGLQTKTSTLTQDVEGFTATISTTVTQLQNYADGAVADGITEYNNTVTQYLEYRDGQLRLGNNIDGFKTILSNTELGFYQGDNRVAYISNNKLYITNAEVTNDLKIGKYQWITDSTGRLSLKWVG